MTNKSECPGDPFGVSFREFLQSRTSLNLPRPHKPLLSILIVLYNRAELTFACLRSLQPRLRQVAAEVILVDNASRDETPTLLKRLRGVTVMRNAENRGFPAAVNQAAAEAAGEFLLLLNNDTEVLGDSLNAALRFLSEHRDVGAAGGRLILLDGMLQEAGCALWREGHVLQYGRGDTPTASEYQFRRDVDYCSGAFLMTRRELFQQMGGLDTSFSPAYFEDADYCVRLWRDGWRVVYLPEVAIHHHENASSNCRQELRRLYHRNHAYFTHKHADWLAWKRPAATSPLWARTSHDDRFRVLLLPAHHQAAATELAHRLGARNCFITVYPIDLAGTETSHPAPEYPPDVEVLAGGGPDDLPEFLSGRRYYYDCILASEPAIIEQVRRWQEQAGEPARVA